MYSVGDRVVCPMHGAGIIENIKEMDILGKKQPYYVVLLSSASMKIMVPVQTSDESNLRSVVSHNDATDLITNLNSLDIEQDKNWSKRYRDNMLRLKTGDINETAKVFKSLVIRNKEKGLSAGERKMLQSAKQILVSELMLSLQKDKIEVEESINSALG